MSEEGGKCIIAIKEAIKTALGVALDETKKTICKPEEYEKALLEVLADILGVDANPTKCDLILQEPISERVCKDFYEQRKWVMCRAHQKLKELHREGKIADFGEVMREAWEELREKCAKAGYVV